MTDTAEPWGAAQSLNCKTDGADNAIKTKKGNKIPQDAKRGGVPAAQPQPVVASRTPNRTGQPSRRSTAGGGYARRARHSWNTMMPALMARMGSDMMVQLHECSPSDEDKKRVDRCFEELQAKMQVLGPRWKLEVFGSVASTFSTNTSDMDATCVHLPSENADDEEQEPNAKDILLERLSPLFGEDSEWSVIEEIGGAKVPILRLRFEDKLDVDLSCCNTGALRNTALLRAYAHLDPRIRELGIAVKIWAKAANVCGAAQSKLSSYTFTLLMVYFMQVHRDVMLPVLSPGLFEDDANPETRADKLRTAAEQWSSSCQLGLADLFFRFIGFYTMDYEWGREVVSVRLGQRRYSHDGVFQALRGRYVQRVHVEDPYLLQRNLHCVLGEPEELALREAFNIAWQMMYRGETPVGLQMHGGEQMQPQTLHLLELTGQSPMSSPDFGPAPAPDLWPMTPMTPGNFDVKEASEAEVAKPRKAQPTEPPGILSSSGSTESGGLPEPCSSRSGSSDDEQALAPGAQSSFRTLKELEKSMVHKQEIAAIAKSPTASFDGFADMVKYGMVGANSPVASPLWGAQAQPATAGGGDKWWLNLGGGQQTNSLPTQDEAQVAKRKSTGNSSVFTVEELEAQPKKNSVFTVADLERQMNGRGSEEPVSGSKGVVPLFGRTFTASATSKIASRLQGKCGFQQMQIYCI